ncbi:hypothetical protein [Chromobacterium alticapitis]|uniref:Uncharacterized protein n=1 Tax=Chromobacterium alticapitis TaxID=2073169 RepID=A0A2S5DI09_9NEIS|nr:hypothetical protein [Chromobacterium alticapitis]POZ62651.1 hypothetical protein C2I19_07335 [Chromobacterium alticapitis]
MGYHSVTTTIAEDNYALGWIAGERVIITQSCILGEEGSEWEGSPVFCKSYLLQLIALSVEHGVIAPAEISAAVGRR